MKTINTNDDDFLKEYFFYKNFYEQQTAFVFQKSIEKERLQSYIVLSSNPKTAGKPEWEERGLNIDNLIQDEVSVAINSSSTVSKEEEELMRLNKGIRKRKDGRYDWRKSVCGTSHYLIHSNLKTLVKMVCEYKKTHLTPNAKIKVAKDNKLIDIAWTWFNLNKKGKIKSEKQYVLRLKNYIAKLNKNIESYTKNDILAFLNEIEEHRTREYCHIILMGVFADAAESGLIKRNPIATLKVNKRTEKGIWFNPSEQKLIYENRHKCAIGHEIEFFMLTGCRLNEAFNCRLELDKLRIWVQRTKSDGSSGYVKISKKYAEHLKMYWHTMFKRSSQGFSKEFGKLLDSLNIKRQKNEKPIHRLRHTFATNIYYLGVDDKKRAYLMGHRKTSITNDVYTDFDFEVSRQEVYRMFGDLYPEF